MSSVPPEPPGSFPGAGSNWPPPPEQPEQPPQYVAPDQTQILPPPPPPPPQQAAAGQYAPPIAAPPPSYLGGDQPNQYGAPAYPSEPRHAVSQPAGPYAAPTPYGGGYGQPYGAPGSPAPYGGVPGMVLPPNYAPYPSQTHREVGVFGLALGLIGAGLVLLGFLTFNWLDSGGDSSFSRFHRAVTERGATDVPTIPGAYFNWLGWALLAAVAVLVILGNLPTSSHALWRVAGILVGFAGVVFTFLAVYKLDDGITFGDVFKHGGPGFWLAIAGFFLAAFGAVIGPRRIRS